MKIGLNKLGICIVEIIMTIAILGIVITPLMSLFILSQKINYNAKLEYEAMLYAQNCMEEIQQLNSIDSDIYEYNSEANCYDRVIYEENNVIIKIIIGPCKDIVYDIEIAVSQNGKELNKLTGSKVFIR